jgi:hypothetical protein
MAVPAEGTRNQVFAAEAHESCGGVLKTSCMVSLTKLGCNQWIDLRENPQETQDTMIFPP